MENHNGFRRFIIAVFIAIVVVLFSCCACPENLTQHYEGDLMVIGNDGKWIYVKDHAPIRNIDNWPCDSGDYLPLANQFRSVHTGLR